ncbi:aldo/keto reductase [Actinoplanes cyaneus]|uniref:Aldo/keto reductase n=1 Tax=Actinoplanes cyaneus TaxID=52696 RepID=A0A919M6Z8_9ACTN|nr:aldo/keto reductase [Actinoplanes cyaneus]MCW2137869.1 putative oxidoreductase [Actinoplanes cyaneus]GID64924.1 aldo/keto reductase [Actinoplanes cyaneus]
MTYRTLGHSGLRVSRAALGTMNFGLDPQAPTPEAEAHRIVGAFLDAGHNLIDTADVYRGGSSEEVVGRAIAHRRAEVVLATKAGGPRGAGPNDRGLSRAHLTRALDASLRRLGTDYIDLYQCHLPDPDTPAEETMAVLGEFVRAGKVRYAGCSNYTAAGIVGAQWAAERLGVPAFVSLQAGYSLIARSIEAEILPVCRSHGLGVLAYSPLGSGVLTGRYRRGAAPEAGSRLAEWAAMPGTMARSWVAGLLADRHFDIADEVAAAAAALGTTSAAVALAWIAERDDITAVVLGPRSAAHLAGALDGLHRRLPAGIRARLDDVSAATVLPAVTGQPRAA